MKRVVEGYYRYHAVPGNLSVLSRFRKGCAVTGGIFCVAVVSGADPTGTI